jgi:pectate lyase
MEYFKNKKNVNNLVILVVVALISFYGGTLYSKSQTPARGQFPNINSVTGQFPGMGGTRGATGARGGGVTAGDIIAKDATSITVKAQDGSTKIVLVSGSTQVAKSTTGTEADLTIGTNVTVIGSANADGSVTAQSVQIRPAGAIPTRVQPQAN